MRRSFPKVVGPMLLLGWMLALSGCADRSGVGRTVPVTGKVLLDCKPLPGGSLVFKPDASKGNHMPFEPAGEIAADGSYTVYTGNKPGAPPGWYKVAVVCTEPPSEKNPYAVPRSLINTRYNVADTSGLVLQVVENAPEGAYDLRLTR